MKDEATGGHGIGAPCKPPSRVQRVRSAIMDDGAPAPLDETREPAKRTVYRGEKTFGAICQRG